MKTKKESIDVVFSFDTTGSMYPCLSQVRSTISETVERLFKDIPDIRIGIVARYCDAPPGPTETAPTTAGEGDEYTAEERAAISRMMAGPAALNRDQAEDVIDRARARERSVLAVSDRFDEMARGIAAVYAHDDEGVNLCADEIAEALRRVERDTIERCAGALDDEADAWARLGDGTNNGAVEEAMRGAAAVVRTLGGLE